jgi:hypothetical protein
VFRGLLAFLAFGQVCAGIYAGLSIPDAGLFNLLFTIGVLWSITEVCVAERAKGGRYETLDAGLFFGWTWPVALPYLLFRYRGFKRGITALAAMIAAYVIPYVVTAICVQALFPAAE